MHCIRFNYLSFTLRGLSRTGPTQQHISKMNTPTMLTPAGANSAYGVNGLNITVMHSSLIWTELCPVNREAIIIAANFGLMQRVR